MSSVYGISVIRTTTPDEDHRGALLRYESVTDLADLPEVTTRLRAEYADRPDVRIDVDTLV